MTQDEIIEMALSCGIGDPRIEFYKDQYEAFAKLVAAKEREACAKVCEEHGKVWAERFLLGFQATLDDAADAIRSRGQA